MKNLLVTIRCLVYNQEPYLRQCLDGFVMQETTFPFEAIVHDDASTDGSATIIREYAERYPDIIKPIYETENQYSKHDGSITHAMDIVMNPNTKYIALCEGDDYWTDPFKLQKQVDFLLSSPNCKFCFCKVKRYSQSKGVFKGYWGKDISTLDEAMTVENAIPTLTICYEKDEWQRYRKEFNPSQYHWHLGDLPLFLWFAHHGGIHFINDVVGVYRELDESASHTKSQSKQEIFLTDVMNIKLLFDKRYNNSKRQIEINDYFMRKFMYLYAYSFRSTKKTISSFKNIQTKNITDYKHVLRYIFYSLTKI